MVNGSFLELLRLQFNSFEGDIPDDFCAIEFLEADCYEDPGSAPDNSCPSGPFGNDCCSLCCDRDSRLCEGDAFRPPPLFIQCDAQYNWDSTTGSLDGFIAT